MLQQITELVKEWFEYIARMGWLKHIDREINKFYRLYRKADAQRYCVDALVEKYKEIYGEDLRCNGGNDGL